MTPRRTGGLSGDTASQARHDDRLPAYSVRVSSRAKNVRLTVNPRDGLVVVVPVRWRGDPGTIVAAHESWALSALARISDARALHQAGPEALLPDVVELRALQDTLPVTYSPASEAPARATRRDGAIVISGDGDPAARLEALTRWLGRAARDELPPRLQQLAAQHGLTPSRVRISSARSRWGSCSGRGTISLNRALLLLPPHLVDALMLHELAHLRFLDHSARFHTFLATLDPEAAKHRRELREVGRRLPPWAGM